MRNQLALVALMVLMPLLAMSQTEKERTASIQVGQSFMQFKDYYTYDLKSLMYSIEWGSRVLGTDGRLYVQSKLNRIHEITHPIKNLKWDGWEAGIAPGFELLMKGGNKTRLYFGGSIGPHYTSVAHLRQKPGFIFTEHVYFSLDVNLKNNSKLMFATGWRHMSNGGISKANTGVDILQARIGFRWNRKARK